MNIQKTDENCFFIELTESDMDAYCLTLCPDGICTEREQDIFLHILKESKEAPDFRKADISILPGIRGGCIAVIREKKEETSLYSVYESQSLDNFIDLAKALKERSLTLTSSLYRGEDCFRLITEKEDEKAVLLLCEFSERLPFPERERAYTESRYKCLIMDNASEILCGK